LTMRFVSDGVPSAESVDASMYCSFRTSYDKSARHARG
jgi:hypothetical protein